MDIISNVEFANRLTVRDEKNTHIADNSSTRSPASVRLCTPLRV